MPSILQVQDVSKSIGELILFKKINLHLNDGEKAALVGINGAGKTSLLNLIVGNENPDAGNIRLADGRRIGYLPQDPQLNPAMTVMETVFKSDSENLKCIGEYEDALHSGNLKKIERCVTLMDHNNLWDFENKIKQILNQLDISHFDQKVGDLSGGQKKRIALANTLLNIPDLLILDEPTNHLDLAIIEWLENYLQRASVSLLMVTHDRFFLDRICNIVFEIDQQNLYKYDGNYSSFVEQRERRIELEELEIEKAQNSLRKEEDWMSRMPKARSTKAKYRIDNYYRLKEKSSQKRNDQNMKLEIKESRLGSKIMVARDINFKWGDKIILKNFNYTFSRFEKIGILGANGTGKSTLLDILTQNLAPDSGILETGETIKFGYYKQSGMQFDNNMKVLDAVTKFAETITLANGSVITVAQFLNYFLFPYPRQNDYIYKLSGGEKRRLYLCTILMQNPNFLILDEPTNDLDIASLQVLEEYLSAFNGCVLVVSHDRYFMDNVVDHLFAFKGNGEIKDFPGNYSAYFEWNKEQEKLASGNVFVSKEKKEKPQVIQKKSKLSYAEKKEFEKLETEIALLENEKKSLEAQLNSGKLDNDLLLNYSEKLGTLITEIEVKTERWMILSEREG